MNNIKSHIIIIIALLWLSVGISSNAWGQCGNELTHVAISSCGKDAWPDKTFRIKYKGPSRRNPIHSEKFTTYMIGGIWYRFSVTNSDNYEGKAIMQLFDKSKLLGSTFDIKTGENKSTFDYYCDKTGSYQLVAAFISNQPGCAIGVQSIIVNDSTSLIPLDTYIDTNNLEPLYIGIDNHLSITVPGDMTPEISISHGEVLEFQHSYIARVSQPGVTKIRVIVRDSNGNIVRAASNLFKITELPNPYTVFAGRKGGYINKRDFEHLYQLEIFYPMSVYKGYNIQSFKLSTDPDKNFGEISIKEKLSPGQHQFLESLNEGDTFYIYDIKILTNEGKELMLPKMEFRVE